MSWQPASSAQLGVRLSAAKAELRGELSPKQPQYLTDAVGVSVHRVRGTVALLAAALGVPERAVYRAADVNDPEPLKAWWIPEVVRVTNSFAVLDVLEARVGRCAFALPSVNPRVDEMSRELARAVQRFGAFLETNGDVLADGRIEKHEIGPMLRSIDDILAGLSEYRALVLEKFQGDERR
jgi:Phage regulatory protein CII (CP76)